MLLGGVVGLGLLAGLLLGRSWAIALPAAAGAGFLALSLLVGVDLRDSPTAFLVLISTVAVAVGVLVRRRGERPTRSGNQGS
jgi:hypothetical protein